MTQVPLLVIAGPTASGKTGVAIKVALSLGGEIISADSMQVYRHMNIGTAKVHPEQRAFVPHHMLDVADPDEDYSLALYQEQATAAARDIACRGKLPILAGGTGLYIQALVDNYPLNLLPHDPACRSWLYSQWDIRGPQKMRHWLEQVDPLSAARIEEKDQRRTIRSLEVWLLTGNALGLIQKQARESSPFRAMTFVLNHPREKLYQLIDQRTQEMVKAGLVQEYISLLERGCKPDSNAMMGLGYRHAGMVVKGLWDVETMTEMLMRDTRRYAKRQLTWFRRIPKAQWLDNADLDKTCTTICNVFAGIQDSVSE